MFDHGSAHETISVDQMLAVDLAAIGDPQGDQGQLGVPDRGDDSGVIDSNTP